MAMCTYICSEVLVMVSYINTQKVFVVMLLSVQVGVGMRALRD